MSPLSGLLSLLMTLSSLYVISASDDANFQPYECYRDLCVSRRQFCSAKEQRCKTCQPAHCQDISAAPEPCRRVCPELLESHSTRSSSTTAPAAVTTAQILQAETNAPPGGKSEGTLLSTGPDEERDIISQWMLLVGMVAFVVLLILVILVLVVITLNITLKLHSRLPPGRKREGLVMVEEGQDLLRMGGGEWGSRGSNKTEGTASQGTESSILPLKTESTSPLLGSYARTDQDSKSVQTDPSPVPLMSPPYTARTASQMLLCEHQDAVIQPPTDGQGEDSLRHLKNHDYRLLPCGDKKMEAGHDLPPPHSPRFPYTASASLYHAGVAGPDLAVIPPSGVEETYPKSL